MFYLYFDSKRSKVPLFLAFSSLSILRFLCGTGPCDSFRFQMVRDVVRLSEVLATSNKRCGVEFVDELE
jgi:hypothetical protein